MNAFQQIIDFLKPELDEKPTLKKVGANYPGQSGEKFKDGLDAALLNDATEHAEKVHGHLTSAQLNKHGLQVSIELPNGTLKSDLKAKQDLQNGNSEKGGILSKLKSTEEDKATGSSELKEGKSEEKLAKSEKNDVSDKKIADANNQLSSQGDEDEAVTKAKASNQQNDSSLKQSADTPDKSTDSSTSEKNVAESDSKEQNESIKQQSKESVISSGDSNSSAKAAVNSEAKDVIRQGSNVKTESATKESDAKPHVSKEQNESIKQQSKESVISSGDSNSSAKAAVNSEAKDVIRQGSNVKTESVTKESDAKPQIPKEQNESTKQHFKESVISSSDSNSSAKTASVNKEADAKNVVAKELDHQNKTEEKSTAKKEDALKAQLFDKKQSDSVEKSKTVQSEVLKEAKKLKNQSDSVEITHSKEKADSKKESLQERFSKASSTNSENRSGNQYASNATNGQNKNITITGAGINGEFSDQEMEENPKTHLSASELRKLDASEENNEAKLLNNSGFLNLRREISGRIAGIIQRQAQSSNSTGSWQHHRFSLDGGKSLNVSMKQSEGKIQLMLGTGNSEIQKLLQQHLQEIKAHLQEQFDLEIELELRQDADNQQNQRFAENLKKNELNNTDIVSTEQETSKSSETDNPVRSFGFNKNEWTG